MICLTLFTQFCSPQGKRFVLNLQRSEEEDHANNTFPNYARSQLQLLTVFLRPPSTPTTLHNSPYPSPTISSILNAPPPTQNYGTLLWQCQRALGMLKVLLRCTVCFITQLCRVSRAKQKSLPPGMPIIEDCVV